MIGAAVTTEALGVLKGESEITINKVLAFLGKGLIALLLIAGGLMLLGVGVLIWNVRPMELPLKSSRQYVRLKEDYTDEIIHAYTGLRWLDSQRYVVIKADPSKFDDRIKSLLAAYPDNTGAQKNAWTASVSQGPGRSIGYMTEKLPKWWDVADLPEVTAVNVGPKYGHHGFLAIFAKDRGLIYYIDR